MLRLRSPRQWLAKAMGAAQGSDQDMNTALVRAVQPKGPGSPRERLPGQGTGERVSSLRRSSTGASRLSTGRQRDRLGSSGVQEFAHSTTPPRHRISAGRACGGVTVASSEGGASRTPRPQTITTGGLHVGSSFRASKAEIVPCGCHPAHRRVHRAPFRAAEFGCVRQKAQ